MSNQLQENLNLILEEKNTKLLPENLKAGVTCLGVTGELEVGGIDTSDATATSDDIISGKTAYVNGEKLEGTIVAIGEGHSVGFQYENVADIGPDNGLYITSVHPDDVTLAIRKNAQIGTYLPYADTASIIGLTGDKIVAGNTILGIEGTASGGGERSSIKQFISAEEMNADPDKQEGDLAIVYGSGLVPLTAGTEVDSINVPYEVHYSAGELPTESFEVDFEQLDGDGHGSFECSIMEMDMGDMGVEKEYNVELRFYNGSDWINVSYTHYDWKKYFRRNYTDPDMADDETLLSLNGVFVANNTIPVFAQKFLQITQTQLKWLYTSKDGAYVLAETQFNVDASDIYHGKVGYGENGPVVGTLGESVDGTIGDRSFRLYNELYKLYEENSIVFTDDNKTIPDWMEFYPIRADGTPVIDTSNVTDFYQMFWCNTRFKKIVLDCSSAKTLERTFCATSNLEEVELLHTENVQNFASTFLSCEKLKYIPPFNMDSATRIDGLFSTCRSLESVPPLNFSNVTSLNSLFQRCNSLKQEDFPDFGDTSRITNMASLFTECFGLITAPEMNTQNVTHVHFMFSGCTNLVNVPVYNFAKVGRNNSTGFQGFIEGCPSLSDESLNNIMGSMATATSLASQYKTMKFAGFSQEQVTKCQSMSNYQTLIDAGWTTGY